MTLPTSLTISTGPSIVSTSASAARRVKVGGAGGVGLSLIAEEAGPMSQSHHLSQTGTPDGRSGSTRTPNIGAGAAQDLRNPATSSPGGSMESAFTTQEEGVARLFEPD